MAARIGVVMSTAGGSLSGCGINPSEAEDVADAAEGPPPPEDLCALLHACCRLAGRGRRHL